MPSTQEGLSGNESDGLGQTPPAGSQSTNPVSTETKPVSASQLRKQKMIKAAEARGMAMMGLQHPQTEAGAAIRKQLQEQGEMIRRQNELLQ